MARCDYCNTSILFGGKKQGKRTFCNDKCMQNGSTIIRADRLPDHVVDAAVDELHQSDCPKCSGPGPTDVHVAHRVWSIVYLTSWNSSPNLCCRSCGRSSQLGSSMFCFFLGWWGFPFGFIMTPVQIARNLCGIFGGPHPDEPSEQLETLARIDLVERMNQGLPLPGENTRRDSSGSYGYAETQAPRISNEPIVVECDCGRSFKVKPTMAGKTGRCPGCGSTITVPSPEVDYLDDDPWESDQSDEYADDWDDQWDDPEGKSTPRRRQQTQRRKSGMGTGIIIGVIAVGLFLFGGCIIGIIMAVKNDDGRPNRPQFADDNVIQPPAIQQPNIPQMPDFGKPPVMPQPVVPGNAFNPADMGNANPITGAPGRPGSTPAPPDPVEPLPNVDPNARLWVVLSNLREGPRNGPSVFNKVYIVDYQTAGGKPDSATGCVLHLSKSSAGGMLNHFADVPVDLNASGSVQFSLPPTFGLSKDFTATMALAKGNKKWQKISGELALGGERTVAVAPPTVLEQSGAAAKGKLFAIANARFEQQFSAKTLLVDYVAQKPLQPGGYYFIVAKNESGDGVEIDVTHALRRGVVVGEESKLGGRLIGPGAAVDDELTLHLEKRRSPIRLSIRRPGFKDEPEVVSNSIILKP